MGLSQGCRVSAKSVPSHLNRPIVPRVSLLFAPESCSGMVGGLLDLAALDLECSADLRFSWSMCGGTGACAGSRWRSALPSGSGRQHSLGPTPDAGHGGHGSMNGMPSDHKLPGGSPPGSPRRPLCRGPTRRGSTTMTASPGRTRRKQDQPHQCLLRAARDAGPRRGRGRAADPRRRLRLGTLLTALRDPPGRHRDRLRQERRDAGAGPAGLGDDADLQVADLDSPLPFPDNTFDDATASLVLHYLGGLRAGARRAAARAQARRPADRVRRSSLFPLHTSASRAGTIARPAARPITSRPATTPLSGPWAARPPR